MIDRFLSEFGMILFQYVAFEFVYIITIVRVVNLILWLMTLKIPVLEYPRLSYSYGVWHRHTLTLVLLLVKDLKHLSARSQLK